MRKTKFLTSIAIFVALFMNFGTLFAQSDSILAKIKTDFKQIKMTKGHHKDVTSVSCSPDGKYVLSGSTDSTLILWNPKSGARLNPLKGHNSFVECVSWSPDGTRFASGSLNGGVIIWDANSLLRVHTLKGHTFGVESICWSPDGKYLASGASDETIVIWDANSGAKLKILEGHEKTVTSVSWSPDGQYLASASKDKTIVIWDANSGQKVKTLQGHTKNVNSVCWSPDGKYLASGSRDKTVIVWDANSGAILQTMKGHTFGVNCVSWSPDGKYLASASWDMSIVLWNPNNGKNLQTLKGHTFSVESLCWTPDGKYLISGAGDQTVRIWSEETEYIYIKVPFPDKKPVRDTVITENKPENGVGGTTALEPPVRKPARDVVTTENKPKNDVETEQTQIEEPAKKIVKKSIEKSESKIIIKEYDQQGKLIKITDKYIDDVDYLEFTLRDGKILSAKASGSSYSDASVDKQDNTAYYSDVACDIKIKFDELGYKEETYECQDGGWKNFYEYNKDGLLEKEVCTSSSVWEPKPTKTTTTYTYDVMSQDWTKRTGKDNKGNKTVTTRTVEYW